MDRTQKAVRGQKIREKLQALSLSLPDAFSYLKVQLGNVIHFFTPRCRSAPASLFPLDAVIGHIGASSGLSPIAIKAKHDCRFS